MAKPKKLTASNILSLHSKTFKQKSIFVDIEGGQYEVLIDTKFQISKIQELIAEVIEKQRELFKIQDIFDIAYYINFLLIKYFTNINLAKAEEFDKQIRVFKAMIDLGIFDQVMEAFDEKEVEKINEYLKKASENVKKLGNSPEVIEDINKMIEDIESLENPEVFMTDEELSEIEEEKDKIAE